MTTPVVDGPAVVPTVVAGLPELGSQALAAALAGRDFPAVLEAFAYDLVVVPVLAGCGGSYQTRVFGASGGQSKPYDLFLFSSAATFAEFLGDSCERLFVILHGAGVVEYIQEQLDQIDRVVVDAAGPYGMSVPARVLASFLEEVDLDLEEEPAAVPVGRLTGWDVPLPARWGVVELADPEVRDRGVKRLVKEQTRALGDQGAAVRHQMRGWLTGMAEKAASAGGVRLAFMLTSHQGVSLALSMVSYWHDFGPQTGPEAHIDRVAQQLVSRARADDETVRIDLGADRVVRHAGLRAGDAGLGAGDLLLLTLDYWVAGPDQRHVAHVAFSSPHVAQRVEITRLADNMVLAGRWVFDKERESGVVDGEVV